MFLGRGIGRANEVRQLQVICAQFVEWGFDREAAGGAGVAGYCEPFNGRREVEMHLHVVTLRRYGSDASVWNVLRLRHLLDIVRSCSDSLTATTFLFVFVHRIGTNGDPNVDECRENTRGLRVGTRTGHFRRLRVRFMRVDMGAWMSAVCTCWQVSCCPTSNTPRHDGANLVSPAVFREGQSSVCLRFEHTDDALCSRGIICQHQGGHSPLLASSPSHVRARVSQRL